MTDRVGALLAESSVLERASRLAPTGLPVLSAFDRLLPNGLSRGTTNSVSGAGATSLALAAATRASEDHWVALVGMPTVGLVWASELGAALDRIVVVPDPGKQWLPVLAALADAFDLVIAKPPRLRDRDVRKLSGRVREQRSVLIAIGDWTEADMRLRTTAMRWHGVGDGYGHLAARTITVTATGRGAASHPRETTLWLPDEYGHIETYEPTKVVRLSS